VADDSQLFDISQDDLSLADNVSKGKNNKTLYIQERSNSQMMQGNPNNSFTLESPNILKAAINVNKI
jgi:hypothetical protein